MKRIMQLLITISIYFIAQNNFAQDTINIPIRKSTFALQFQIGSSFNLQSFQGSTLSFKYHFSDESAIRVGTSLYSSIDTYREEYGIEKEGGKSYSIILSAQFIKYLKSKNDVSLYFGGGPQYYRRYYKAATSSNGENYWSLGINGILGVEWFFKKNMSLSGEYGLLFYYNVEKGSYSSGNGGYTVKGFNTTDYNMLKFGLSVYI